MARVDVILTVGCRPSEIRKAKVFQGWYRGDGWRSSDPAFVSFADQPVGALLRASTGFFLLHRVPDVKFLAAGVRKYVIPFNADSRRRYHTCSSMKRACLLFAVLLTALSAQFPQDASNSPRREETPARLPNGKLQSEEILKDDYKRNLKDAQDLIDLAESLKMGLEKGEQHVLSLGDIKKTEEIEKLAKRIRGRMRRY